MISERGQSRPGDWPSEVVSRAQATWLDQRLQAAGDTLVARTWIKVGRVDDFPANGGATIKYGKVQIAVFNFTRRGAWYACQQMCQHRKTFVLSRGILGDTQGTPKVACPLHKKTFALDSGACLSGDDYRVQVFPVKVEHGEVYLHLPPTAGLDQLLGTDLGCRLATSCEASADGFPIIQDAGVGMLERREA